MKKLTLSLILILCCLTSFAQNRNSDPNPEFRVIVETSKEAIAPGKWQPTVESLSAWECPEWFRDAKFGIWAHWGPQCEPEDGDWYARNMYIEGNGQYQYNIDARDHPSRWGFKDWIHEWKAENWDPDALIKFYKEVGARYFFTLANHHDNFDLYDSKYQSWNSVALGPEKDIVGGWAEACRKYGLRLGVSVHAAHAWVWYETSRGADTKGPLAGVPYDGVLNKEDGVGTWWEGLDPQELYEQRHPLSKNNRSWDWEEDLVTTPDQAFCDKIYNRTVQLINDYNPDIVYFDDTYLPLWPVSDAGLKILAHGYNKSAERNGGESQIVFTGKVLTDWQKKTLLWDVERGAPDAIQDLPWQTCTCIGEWHYNKHVYYEDRYKTSAQVISMLVDVVSKNGNLLLSVPLRGDGTPDPTEIRIVTQILAVLAAFCEGTSAIQGTGRLAGKESDRAKAILEMLHQMGVTAAIEQDTLLVEGHSLSTRLAGGRLLNGGSYTSGHDHRMVMALKVASLAADGPIIIDDTECVSKSFPTFLQLFDNYIK